MKFTKERNSHFPWYGYSVNVEKTSTLGVRAGNINLQSPSITMLAPLIIMSSLPTSDPGIAGALYIISQSLKVSLGG